MMLVVLIIVMMLVVLLIVMMLVVLIIVMMLAIVESRKVCPEKELDVLMVITNPLLTI